MKSQSLVKRDGHLRNPNKSQRELQNADLSRPSDKERQKNLVRTQKDLGMLTQKAGQPAFLSTQLQSQKELQDTYVRYKPVTAG